MKLRVVSVCYNELEMLPWYLRHYEQFADEIVLYDDDSTDGTQAVALCCDRVTLRSCPFKGLVDDKMMELWQSAIHDARKDRVDWLIMPDIDEILWAKEGPYSVLANAQSQGFNAIASQGWNMAGDGLPKDDGHSQIYHLLNTGVLAPVYAKTIIVNPKANVTYDWNRGRHALAPAKGLRVTEPQVKLLHYRYLGYDYTARRNARNYDRVGTDKGCAWSNAPNYHGEHSAKWAATTHRLSLNALETPL